MDALTVPHGKAFVEAGGGGEEVMGPGRLLRVVGSGVSADHVWRGVTQEVLDVQLAGILLDRPGGKSVSEAMGMDLRDARLPAESAEHLLDGVGQEAGVGHKVAMTTGGYEEPTGLHGTGFKITPECPRAVLPESYYPLLVSLAVQHPETLSFEVEV